MTALYNIGILIYKVLAHIAALFSSKAKLWVNGQKSWKKILTEKISLSDKVFWIHCSSLGEFEQGRPVIEQMRKQKPDIKILLTFFSPSGYEIRKNYAGADCICYLPADTSSNAAEFLNIAHPSLAVFVKYEFWHNHIAELNRRSIPLYLISAIFRPEQHFFKWYGSFFRAMLEKFEKIYVQDERSVELLKGINIKSVMRAGDTRFDRVVEIARSAKDIPQISSFRNGEKLFLAGSSWRPDEEIIARYINLDPGRMKWVFAPHEIDESNISRIEKLFTPECVRFSRYSEASSDARVLIIDNIGMLSSAYRYAAIAAVGGGFGKGIHNILEPACWGIPVLFGPGHEKFREAVELLKVKGGMTFDSFDSFKEILDKLLNDDEYYLKSARSASQYVNENTGATGILMSELVHRI
ncbi:MAG TPA: glycosyltransferase N-terminal domain-containing protein [Bacteroidales bacterium]|nr:glycosyltransferase N-terminal domain-containing protein [Bacteroidales bacterium]